MNSIKIRRAVCIGALLSLAPFASPLFLLTLRIGAAYAQTTTTKTAGGSTPSGLVPGSPGGSYALSNVDQQTGSRLSTIRTSIQSAKKKKIPVDRRIKRRARDPECVKECQRRHRDRVEICDDLFNSPGSVYYRNVKWHRQCLVDSRTEFDNCLSTCGQIAKTLSGGSIMAGEWRLVYAGQGSKCYNILYLREVRDTWPVLIAVEVDGTFKERLDAPDESTDVCGQRIVLRGSQGRGKAFWSATEIRSR